MTTTTRWSDFFRAGAVALLNFHPAPWQRLRHMQNPGIWGRIVAACLPFNWRFSHVKALLYCEFWIRQRGYQEDARLRGSKCRWDTFQEENKQGATASNSCASWHNSRRGGHHHHQPSSLSPYSEEVDVKLQNNCCFHWSGVHDPFNCGWQRSRWE